MVIDRWPRIYSYEGIAFWVGQSAGTIVPPEPQGDRLGDTPWRPSASLPTTGDYIYLESEAGDPIGRGREYLYTPLNSRITLSESEGIIRVHVSGFEAWDGQFVPERWMTELETGYYPDTNPGIVSPPEFVGLIWSGMTRSANDVTGWFFIDNVVYTDGVLTELDLRFEQRCGSSPALHGQIHWRGGDSKEPPEMAAPPDPDALWEPDETALPESGNYVYLDSDLGDSIGMGDEYLYTSADAVISVVESGGLMTLDVDGDEEWSGDFRTMNSLTQIEPGFYPGLTRYPFHDPAVGGLSWSGEGRGTETLTGWFYVDSVTYTDGELSSIDLRFAQHSEGGAPALHGAIHWSIDDTEEPPGPVNPIPDNLWRTPPGTVPANGNYIYLASDPGDFVGGGSTYLYTPSAESITVSAIDGHLVVTAGGFFGWHGDFQTMNSITEFEPGYYPDLQRYPFHNPTKGGLAWYGYGRGSNTLTGWFVVDSVWYEDGELTAIDLRFEQHSEGEAPALHGAVHWEM